MNEIERLLGIIERQQVLIESLTTALFSRESVPIGHGQITPANLQQSPDDQGVGRIPWNQLKARLEKRYSKSNISEIGVPNNASEERETIRTDADGEKQPILSRDWKPPFTVRSEGIHSQDTYGEEEEIRKDPEK